MKKITLVLVLLLAFGFASFADDAAPAVKLTGELSHTIGADNQTDTPDLPVMSYGQKATAGITLSSADDMVSASIELDLLATQSVTAKTVLDQSVGSLAADYSYDEFSDIDTTIVAYQNWETIEADVALFNTIVDWVDDEADDIDIFTQATEVTAFLALLNAYPATIGTLAEDTDADDDIDILLDPVGPNDTAESDEFLLDNAAAADLATMVGALTTYLDGMLDDAVEFLLNNADTAAVQALDTRADLEAYIIALTAEDVDDLTLVDDEQITEAVKYISEYAEEQDTVMTADTTVTVTAPKYIKKASFMLKGIGGVVDITGNLTDTNVKVGMISLDRKGHQEDAVKSYPSITAALSAGVVEGLKAGVTFYSDDNDVKDQVDAVSDVWYTWVDETDAQDDPVEPALGLKADLGYSLPIGEMSVGANASIGLYDMAGGDDSEFGFSVKPTFSGMGATVGVQFDSGLGMTYIGADASYSIMGIVPSVSFAMVTNTDDDVIAWVKDDEYKTGMAAVKDAGGMSIGGGVKVDVGQFIGLPASLSGGATYAMPTDLDAILGWNAALSVTPIEMLTIKAGAEDKAIWLGDAGAYLGWNADATLALAPFTIKGGVSQKYLADDDDDPVQKFAWSGSAAYKYGIATITASVGSAWDNKDDEDYMKWSVVTKLKF